jgi:DNA gyrase subunit A
LRKAEERAHLLEGFRIALDNIDEVIAIVREQRDRRGRARSELSSALRRLSDVQANAIVDMRLRTLTGLERQKIEDEYNALLATIADLKTCSPVGEADARRRRDETLDVKKRSATPAGRRSKRSKASSRSKTSSPTPRSSSP